jgi:hypothetical protein
VIIVSLFDLRLRAARVTGEDATLQLFESMVAIVGSYFGERNASALNAHRDACSTLLELCVVCWIAALGGGRREHGNDEH